MIQTFKNKALENLFRENVNKGVPANLEKKIRIRLEVIDSALIVEDIRLPGYDLHELKGDRKGTWSIKISGNWRITFKFEDGDAYDVNLEDYH
ncbi:type II toxin-antitoxin system RelE/ParE family toxin [Anabaena cylindrica UHCC 0172]|uniref:type II toxin-antitoxin system RelE/ParE family toxin n=1 Tax=Anabaena cylindrica TaxID=1165 RepID=UPI002B202E1A|nr:type II toxin-antitoxin system RelE/ParE family toxin [Anabaena cylindrica]MEA5554652.1 type II toxin-antitoxin system RelE/ParE family toxin [Anabaena cylindrica UHCC 0172]